MSFAAPAWRMSERGVPVLVSLALHLAVLMALSTASLRLIPPPQAPPIPVRIWQPPAPPPLPAAAHAAAPPVAAQPVLSEHPKLQRGKPRAKPAPAIIHPPNAVAVQPPPSSPVEAAEAAAPTGGTRGGVLEGVRDGQLGGQVGGTGDRVLRLDQVAAPPRLVKRVAPAYPPLARARGQEGVVVVEAVIDRDGAVEPAGVTVVQSVPDFDAAALAAFRGWRFTPGRDGHGSPVRVLVRQPIRFQLR